MPPGADPAPRRWLAEGRASRRLALAVVFVALLLDNMLLTVVGRAAGHLGGDPACRDGCGCAGRGEPRGGMGVGAARASSLSQHAVQLAQNQLKSLTTIFFFLSVPIIPTFLYTTEYKGANSSAAPRQPELAPPAVEASPFSSVFSYFDNSTVTVSGSSSTAEPLNGTTSGHTRPPPTSLSPPPRGCLEGEEFLANENVRVGLLFASKALVQLMVNPFVGLLTNRYVRDPLSTAL